MAKDWLYGVPPQKKKAETHPAGFRLFCFFFLATSWVQPAVGRTPPNPPPREPQRKGSSQHLSPAPPPPGVPNRDQQALPHIPSHHPAVTHSPPLASVQPRASEGVRGPAPATFHFHSAFPAVLDNLSSQGVANFPPPGGWGVGVSPPGRQAAVLPYQVH